MLADGRVFVPNSALPAVQVKLLGQPLGTLEQPRTVVVGHGEIQVKDATRIVAESIMVERDDTSVGEVLLSHKYS